MNNFIMAHAEHIKDLQEAIKESTEEFIKYLKENKDFISQEVINFYYWNTDLELKILVDVLDLKQASQIAHMASKSYEVMIKCKECGQDAVINPTSRNNMHDIVNADYLWQCDNCKAISREEKRKNQEELSRVFSSERASEEEKWHQEIKRLKSLPYKQYLQTEHWQKIRRNALKRANNRCQLCNSGGLLNVHHRHYETKGEEKYTDVIVLCQGCHGKFHDKMPTI
ncbi:MAG: hypothetical protein JL50_10950 [Peptococcaceae bacterium BICA1-7]|nr:MAG: hypothetical protein JL50_10950 [Peptococcaceae bacterium BICA1-7]HBV95804.1 HNH endonuclease [Desulfotomaculum sp.]